MSLNFQLSVHCSVEQSLLGISFIPCTPASCHSGGGYRVWWPFPAVNPPLCTGETPPQVSQAQKSDFSGFMKQCVSSLRTHRAVALLCVSPTPGNRWAAVVPPPLSWELSDWKWKASERMGWLLSGLPPFVSVSFSLWKEKGVMSLLQTVVYLFVVSSEGFSCFLATQYPSGVQGCVHSFPAGGRRSDLLCESELCAGVVWTFSWRVY